MKTKDEWFFKGSLLGALGVLTWFTFFAIFEAMSKMNVLEAAILVFSGTFTFVMVILLWSDWRDEDE